ncbi:MAG: bifunctional 2-polyprenyl-6-hydroxyphenol methylase/3-demethylubiquinol 3-O-methyltransferase UbiG [Hormoscilla sp.]
MKTSTITERNYLPGEEERLTSLVAEYGVHLEQRNLDIYSDIGLEGWWGANGIHHALHDMNPIRGGFVIDLLKRFDIVPPKGIIEVGCGGGIFCEYLAKQGYQVLGVDMSRGAIKVAQEHAVIANVPVEYQVSNVYELPFEDESFDVVMSSNFLQHVEDLVTAFSQMSRILKKGGLFIFDTISRNEYSVTNFMKLEAEGIIIPGAHEPLLLIKPEEVESLAKQFGIALAADVNNPFGLIIEAIECIDGKFQLQKVTQKETLQNYIGYGIKTG